MNAWIQSKLRYVSNSNVFIIGVLYVHDVYAVIGVCLRFLLSYQGSTRFGHTVVACMYVHHFLLFVFTYFSVLSVNCNCN